MKIVSGGQTGVDRAALDAARELGLGYGGYVPRGRWTEQGPLPAAYEGMVETEGRHPEARTKRNVRESDATLIIGRGECEGGTRLTLITARDSAKPYLHIDLATMTSDHAAAAIREWLRHLRPSTLNIAGPRASKDSAIYEDAKGILVEALSAAL